MFVSSFWLVSLLLSIVDLGLICFFISQLVNLGLIHFLLLINFWYPRSFPLLISSCLPSLVMFISSFWLICLFFLVVSFSDVCFLLLVATLSLVHFLFLINSSLLSPLMFISSFWSVFICCPLDVCVLLLINYCLLALVMFVSSFWSIGCYPSKTSLYVVRVMFCVVIFSLWSIIKCCQPWWCSSLPPFDQFLFPSPWWCPFNLMRLINLWCAFPLIHPAIFII